jgi:hypothetical protein
MSPLRVLADISIIYFCFVFVQQMNVEMAPGDFFCRGPISFSCFSADFCVFMQFCRGHFACLFHRLDGGDFPRDISHYTI